MILINLTFTMNSLGLTISARFFRFFGATCQPCCSSTPTQTQTWRAISWGCLCRCFPVPRRFIPPLCSQSAHLFLSSFWFGLVHPQSASKVRRLFFIKGILHWFLVGELLRFRFFSIVLQNLLGDNFCELSNTLCALDPWNHFCILARRAPETFLTELVVVLELC